MQHGCQADRVVGGPLAAACHTRIMLLHRKLMMAGRSATRTSIPHYSLSATRHPPYLFPPMTAGSHAGRHSTSRCPIAAHLSLVPHAGHH